MTTPAEDDFGFEPELAPAPAQAPAARSSAAHGNPPQEWLNYIDSRDGDGGVSASLVKGLIETESNWNPAAKNPRSSATGLGQFIDSTADEVGITDRTDPHQNIDAIYDYLGQKLKQHSGDERAALKAYGEPTDEYVGKVQSRAAAWAAAGQPTANDDFGFEPEAEERSPAASYDDSAPEPTQSIEPHNYSTPTSSQPWSLPSGETDIAAFNAWRTTQAGLSPLKATEAWDLAEKRGLDPTWTANNFDEVSKAQDTDDRAALLAVHPGLARLANDPVTGSIVKDDMKNATQWDALASQRSAITHNPFIPEWLDNIGKAMWEGADPEHPYLAAKAMLGKAGPQDMARLQELESQPDQFPDANPFERAVYGAAGAVPFVGEIMLAGGAASLLGAPAAGVAAITSGAAGLLTFAQNVGPSYRRNLAAGASEDSAFGWAVGSSTVAAGLMSFGAPAALGVKSLIGAGAKDAASAALADLSMRGSIEGLGKQLGGHWLMGTGMMTAQAAANSIGEQMSKPGEFDSEKVWQDSKAAAISAGGAMALLVPFGPAVEFARDQGRLARVTEDASRFDTLANSVKESSVSNPQIERIITELRQSGVQSPEGTDRADTVYVDRDAFDAAAKSKGVSARDLAGRILGDGGVGYDTGAASGTALPIPIEKYASSMVRSGLHDMLRADVKFSADGWTQREATAAQEQLSVYAAKSAPLAAEVAAVRERELHKALAAGQPMSQAQAHADIAQAITLRHAIRTGLSPEAAYSALNFPEIVGPGGIKEPLANIPTPLPPPGQPRGPVVEDWQSHVLRRNADPNAPDTQTTRNPYIRIETPASEPTATVEDRARDIEEGKKIREGAAPVLEEASKAMAGPKGDLGLGLDESKAAGERLREEAGPVAAAAPEAAPAEPEQSNVLAERMELKTDKIRPALEAVARANPALDETARVKAGLDLISQARSTGKTIDQVVKGRQTANYGERASAPEAQSMAHMLEGRSASDLESTFNAWAKYASTPGADLETARSMLRHQSIDLDGSTQRLAQPAYHGTPHDVDSFKMEKIGTGEGAQVYGHGLYFAENKGIADWYREKLSENVESDSNAVRPLNAIASGSGDADKIRALADFMDSYADASDPRAALNRWTGSIQKELASAAEGVAKATRDQLPDLPEYLAKEAVAQKVADWADELTVKDFKYERGRLYQVDVPESDRLLDYDKDFSHQPKMVQDALRESPIFDNLNEYLEDHGQPGVEDLSGRQIYQALTRLASEVPLFDYSESEADKYEGDQDKNRAEASEFLRRIGIPGLRYLDANSRGAGEGSRNFVIWDEDEIRNLQRLKQEGVSPEESKEIARGSLTILSGKDGKRYTIHLGPGADASTLAHETAHWLADTLSDAANRPGADPELKRDMASLMKWAGYAEGEREKGLIVPNEEKIASGWEQYLAEGSAPVEGLRGVFGRFSKWMAKIYGGIAGIAANFEKANGEKPPGMNDEIRGIFDRMLATSDDIEQDRASREAARVKGSEGGNSGGTPPSPPGGGNGGSDENPPPPRRKPVVEQTRKWANGVLAKQPLSSISDKFYLDAERKNSRRSIDFAAEGKHEESRNADVTRSFAAALHDAAKDILKTADKQLEKVKALASPEALTKIAKSAAEDLGHEYLDVQQSILEGIGLRQPGRDASSRNTDVTALLNRLDFDGRDPAFDPEGLRSFLAKPKPWASLTPEEASNLTDAATQIRTAANGANKLIIGSRSAERRATIDAMTEFASKRPDQGLEPVTRSADEGLLSKALKATGLYNADNLKPETIWKKFGPEGLALWGGTLTGDGKTTGRNAAAKMKGEVLRSLMELSGPLLEGGRFSKMLRGELSPETLRDLNTPNGVMLDGSKMNVETLLMAFLNMGTTGPTGSDGRLLGGYKWNEATLLKAIGREVPKEMLDFGQQILDFSEQKIKPLIWDHEEAKNGIAPPALERRPIIIRHADGTATKYDGGYFAAKYNSDASNFARQRVGSDAVESLDRGARASVASSFTKGRSGNYKDVVDLNWSNYPNHINSVLHYLAYDEPVRSIGSVLRDRAFREMATRRIGTAELKQLDESIKTISRGTSADPAASASYTSKLISGVLRSRPISNAIGFSFGVAAQQIPSHMEYAVTAGKISAKNGNFALGRALVPDNWTQALSKSSELQYRADHYSELFRDALSGKQEALGGWKRKTDVAAFAMMDYADRTLSHVVWDAAYRDALEGRKLFDGSIAGNDAAAVEHADRTLRDLMPTHNRFEMAGVVRNPGALGALQLFRGLKNVVWNTEASIFDKARVENQGSPLIAAAGRYGFAAARIIGSAAVLHMLGKFWGGHGKNDDDGEGLQGWATWAERSAAASLVSLNVPFGGEVAEGVADHLAHGESLSDAMKHGAAELRPAPGMAMLQDSVKRLGVMVDNDAEPADRIGAATQLLLSNLGGYANQAGKTGGYIKGVVTGDEQPRNPLDAISGGLYGSPGKKNTKTPATALSDLISGSE